MASSNRHILGALQSRFLLVISAAFILATLTSVFVSADVGREMAYYDTSPFDVNVTHRQSLCDRFDQFSKGEIELRDALEGIELRALIGAYKGAYFNYDPVEGIDAEYPGIVAVLME